MRDSLSSPVLKSYIDEMFCRFFVSHQNHPKSWKIIFGDCNACQTVRGRKRVITRAGPPDFLIEYFFKCIILAHQVIPSDIKYSEPQLP